MRRLSRLLAGDAPFLAAAWLAPLYWLWPLPAAPGRTLPGAVFWYDAVVVVDSVTAIGRNLLSGRPLYDGAFFWPQPAVHTFNDVLVGPALAALPFTAAGEPWLAHNLLLYVSFALTAIFTFRLVLAFSDEGAPPRLAERLVALAAAFAFTFCSYKAFNLGRLQNEVTFLLPLALLTGRAAVVRGRLRDGAAFAAVVLAQAVSCAYYTLFLLVALPLALLPEWLRLRRYRELSFHLRIGLPLVAAALVAFAVVFPYVEARRLLGIVRSLAEVREQAGDLQQLLFADRGSWLAARFPFLRDRWAWDSANFPGLLGPLGVLAGAAFLPALALGGTTRRSLVAALSGPPLLVALLASAFLAVRLPGGQLLPWLGLGGCALAVALLADRARAGAVPLRSLALLALCALGALAIYFGPEVHVRLQERALGPGPFRLLFDHVPGFDGMRTVRRASILLTLALCAGAGVVLRAAAARLPRLLALPLGLAALALAVLEVFNGPVRLLPAPTLENGPGAYRFLAAHPDGRPVAELPGRKRRDDVNPTLARHYAQLHGHPTTAGHASYLPPLPAHLAELLGGPVLDDVLLAELRAVEVGWVVLHRERLGAAYERLLASAAERPTGLRLAAKLPDGAVYELLPGPRAQDPGEPAAGLRTLPVVAASATGPGAETAGFAVDGDEASRFVLTTQQRPGLSLSVELAAVSEVAELVLLTRDPSNWPRAVAVDADDGSGLREVLAPMRLLPVRALATTPRRYELPLRLPPGTRARSLRIRLEGSDPTWWWSVHELSARGP